tara:strand:+ start:1877 stop:2464 length:588 start_codon:yes stop_codon:yes gene_type:complete
MLGVGAVQAHSADTFTVVIKQSGLMPGSSQITYNDSVVWHNTDGRENITHRIVFDFDGDGLFNGTDDWDSGELVADCNTTTNENETGATNESDCNVTFMVWFNGTWGIGEYNYEDRLSDGTVLNGTIVVVEDVHIENSTAPDIGSTFGTFEDRKNSDEGPVEEEDNQAQRMLLLIGVGSGIGAAGLLVLLLVRRS